jgi:hypothetical protein
VLNVVARTYWGQLRLVSRTGRRQNGHPQRHCRAVLLVIAALLLI